MSKTESNVGDDRALRDSEERFRQMVGEHSFDIAGAMLLVLKPSQEVVLLNSKGCEILGRKKEEVIGKHWTNNFLPAKDRDRVNALFSKLVAGEIDLVEYVENPVLSKTGEERLISWHNTVLRDQAGKIIASLSSGQDITERKRAEQALRSSEEQLADNLHEVLFILTTEPTRMAYISPAYDGLG